ncbi:MAG: aminopeptidase, partial [Elusimicrobiaceae bacterium]|nr:aminopeptidase [Elusimicrobiaceae bacterium]
LDKKLKEKLGFNDSSLHWDLINTEDKTVIATLVNGSKKVIYQHGQFTY